MIRYTFLVLATATILVGCNTDRGPKMQDFDKNGVPLDRGKAECKAQARAQAADLAKGNLTANPGIADDLYSDCLQRRGYFAQ